MSAVYRWPWGVAAVSRRDGRVVGLAVPGLVNWWGWCDCGWKCTRRRRKTAATALANHTHLPPNPFRPGSAAGRPDKEQ